MAIVKVFQYLSLRKKGKREREKEKNNLRTSSQLYPVLQKNKKKKYQNIEGKISFTLHND
jgi:hypothetical protein